VSGLGFLAVSFLLNIKKVMARKIMWLGLIALFVSVALSGRFAQSETAVIVINAGVFYNPSSLFEASIVSFLNESVHDTNFIEFVFYDDLDELLRDVALGRLECAYVFNANIENAQTGDLTGIVTVIVSERTIATPILNDIVASAVLRASVEDITRDGLIGLFGESDELDYFVEWQFLAYSQMDIFMTPSFDGEYGQAYRVVQSPSTQIAARALHGLIGLTLLILSMFCAVIFIEERATDLNAALRAHRRLALYDVSLWMSAFVAVFIIGLAGQLAMILFAPNIITSIPSATAAIAMYVAICALFLTLAARLLKNAGLIQSFGLFLVILNIFFGGVLLDLVEISDTLANLQRLFPLFWYIEMSL